MPEMFDRRFCQHCGTHSFGHENFPRTSVDMVGMENLNAINMPSWHILYRRQVLCRNIILTNNL